MGLHTFIGQYLLTLIINPINNSNSEVKDENSRKKAGIISLLTGA